MKKSHERNKLTAKMKSLGVYLYLKKLQLLLSKSASKGKTELKVLACALIN